MSAHGKIAEDIVQRLCSKTFLQDFVYRSPEYLTQTGKSLEFADLLLPMRGALVSLQIKSRMISPNSSLADGEELGRLGKRIARATEQIKSLKRAIASKGIGTIKNVRGIDVPFTHDENTRIIGIVILDVVGAVTPDEEQSLEIRNGLDEISGAPVHAFLLRDFELVAQELDTLPDLISYLDTREKLMRKRCLSPLTRERDLLAIFKSNYPLIEKCLNGECTEMFLEDGIWEQYKKSCESDKRDDRRMYGEVIDNFIEKVHETIGIKVEREDGEFTGTPESYVAIANELSRLHRSNRIKFGQKVIEKMKNADTDPKGFSYCAYAESKDDAVFVFLSGRIDRDQLRERLIELAAIAKIRCHSAKSIGIATQPLSSELRAYDFVYFDNDEFTNYDELLEKGKLLFPTEEQYSADVWGNTKPKL